MDIDKKQPSVISDRDPQILATVYRILLEVAYKCERIDRSNNGTENNRRSDVESSAKAIKGIEKIKQKQNPPG